MIGSPIISPNIFLMVFPSASNETACFLSDGTFCFDVAIDIRRGSPTYGQWKGYELTSENGHQLYIPVGFAHGFMTLEPDSEIVYKCTEYYSPETEGAVHWNSCKINWPIKDNLVLSDKDISASLLQDLNSPFVYGVNS